MGIESRLKRLEASHACRREVIGRILQCLERLRRGEVELRPGAAQRLREIMNTIIARIAGEEN